MLVKKAAYQQLNWQDEQEQNVQLLHELKQEGPTQPLAL